MLRRHHFVGVGVGVVVFRVSPFLGSCGYFRMCSVWKNLLCLPDGGRIPPLTAIGKTRILQRNISIKNVVLLAQCDQADDAQGALATSRTNQTRFARETQRLRVESERFSQERRRDKSLEEKSGGKESGRVLLRDGEEKDQRWNTRGENDRTECQWRPRMN